MTIKRKKNSFDKNIYRAIRQKDVLGKEGIAENVNRPDVGKSRNDWAKGTARSIRF